MQVQDKQLEQTNGQDPVVRYSPAEAEIATLRQEFTGLTCDTPTGYEQTRKAIAVLRTHRTTIEKRRVELKAEALSYGRRVDSEAKKLTSQILAIEEPLKAAKQTVDDEKDRLRRESEEAERARVAAEEKAARDAEEARLKAIRDAEDARLAEERRSLAAERARMQEEQRRAGEEYAAKLKAERELREREEAERQAKQAAIDAENRRVAQEQRAAQEKLEAERRAVQAEKERVERLEFERQAKEKAELNARELAERDRLLDKEHAEAKALEAKRLAEARPDEEKIRAFGKELRAVKLPATRSPAVMGFMLRLAEDLNAMAYRCEDFSVR